MVITPHEATAHYVELWRSTGGTLARSTRLDDLIELHRLIRAGADLDAVRRILTSPMSLVDSTPSRVKPMRPSLCEEDAPALLCSALGVGALDLVRTVGTTGQAMGMPCFLVGGPVRDLFLGRMVEDLDIAVQGDAHQLAVHLCEQRGGRVVLHQRCRTATWAADGHVVDLATTRRETYASVAAPPLVDIDGVALDLVRRDYTINAMALRLDEENFGTLVDPLGGLSDLEGRTLRLLHDLSYRDDPTRLFRGIRFQVRLDLEPDPNTSRLMNEAVGESLLLQLGPQILADQLALCAREYRCGLVFSKLENLGLLRQLTDSPRNKASTAVTFDRVEATITDLGDRLADRDRIYPFLVALGLGTESAGEAFEKRVAVAGRHMKWVREFAGDLVLLDQADGPGLKRLVSTRWNAARCVALGLHRPALWPQLVDLLGGRLIPSESS